MEILGKVKRSYQVNLSSPQAYDLFCGGLQSSSGVVVNQNTILSNSAVWRAVNLISSSIARLPCNLFKVIGDSQEKDKTHPVWRLLRKAPNSLLSPYSFFHTMVSSMLINGNSYAYINRDYNGTPIELIILDSQGVTPVKVNGQPLYVVHYVDGGQDKILPENILHFKSGLSSDVTGGWYGLPVWHVLREALSSGLTLQKYSNVFFKNSGLPSLVVELPGDFKNEEALIRFKQGWESENGGLANSNKPRLLTQGAKLSKIGVENNQAQFLESREFDLKTVANIFGLPLHKVSGSGTTSYSSLEQENISFLNDSLSGHLCSIESELEQKLLSNSEFLNSSVFIEFERKSLQQADTTSTINALVAQSNNGLLTKNEARAILNLPKVGAVGDVLLSPANLETLESSVIREEQAKKALEAPHSPSQAASVAESPQQPPTASRGLEMAPVTPDSGSILARKLFDSAFMRLKNRLLKDIENKEKLNSFVERHEKVFVESLSFENEDKIKSLLYGIHSELENVLPEQRQKVIEDLNNDKVYKELYDRA